MNPFDCQVREATQHSGWTTLLPSGQGDHVVCLETGTGHTTLALASIGARVTSVLADPALRDDVERLVLQAGVEDVTIASGWDAVRRPDGLVAIMTDRGTAASREAWMAALRAATETVAPRYVLLAGTTGRGSDSGQLEPVSLAQLEKMAARLGSRDLRCWPMRLAGQRPYEMLSPEGLRGLTSRLGQGDWKGALLRSPAARWLAPAHAVVGGGGPVFLDRLLSQVHRICGRGAL